MANWAFKVGFFILVPWVAGWAIGLYRNERQHMLLNGHVHAFTYHSAIAKIDSAIVKMGLAILVSVFGLLNYCLPMADRSVITGFISRRDRL